MDQVAIRTKQTNKSTLVIYADPKSRGFHDLLIKGGQFYAVYDPATGFWRKDLSALSESIDRDILEYRNTCTAPEGVAIVPELMDNMSNGAWMRYLNQMRGLTDSRVQLDQKIFFNNDTIRREDYASFKEPYDLVESPIPNYEKLMSTIYDPAQRQKLEWGIGLLVDGKHVKRTQKFFVICGDPGTGKSTVLHIIEQLFAGYVSYFNAKELGQGYTFATAAFKDAPLVAIQTDGDLSKISDNTLINQIAGHETIIVNEKGVKQYPVELKTIMFLASNKPVEITDSQSGLTRRLIDVYPSGRKLPNDEYFEALDNIRYELGGIAWHCLQVFRKMGPNAYGSYVAKEMVARTNDIYSFLSSKLDEFSNADEIDAYSLWKDYSAWCEDANIQVRMKRDDFIYEVESYFQERESAFVNGRMTTRNTRFRGFKWDKFISEWDRKETAPDVKEIKPLTLESTESKFDILAKDWPAQYASNNDLGNPVARWADVHTTLKDIDTSKLHWVKVPENHIVLDFDLQDEHGEKSLEANLKAAAEWPPTYAELSKSGGGVHLHYIYDGDVNQLSPIVSEHIECKVYKGNSALRRRLTKCNDLPVAHISSGLPKKEGKRVINEKAIKDETHLRNLIRKCLRKECGPGTKPNIDFICKLLDEAYENGIVYDVTDMRDAVLQFAMGSTHHPDYCIKVVANMKFKSAPEEVIPATEPTDVSVLTFFDVEVFPNLFMICYKDSDKDVISTLINPSPDAIRTLCTKNLVGFNNRKYDNHMLYAWGWMKYDNKALYNLSQRIVNGDKDSMFRNAYNISYTDIFDFSSKKQSLKKWEIELGIDHHELGLPWDQPVDEKLWPTVQSYCEDDVRATQAVFEKCHEDFVARQALATLSGLTVNDTTNQHTTRIIFGDDAHPQREFPFPDLAETFPGYSFDPYQSRELKSSYRGEHPGEGGYVWVYGMANGDGPDYEHVTPAYIRDPADRLEQLEAKYRDLGLDIHVEHPELVSRLETMLKYPFTDYPANPDVDPEHKKLGGMFGNVGLYDVASMHPSSLEAMNFFGKYTKRFSDIKRARLAIKHGNLTEAKSVMDGALAPLLKEGEDTDGLAQALKIVINSVYGLTSATFPTKFNDAGNGRNNRNLDNKVAKRGALFMILLKHNVQELGYTVVHIKTDSIKIADSDDFIQAYVEDFGRHYGYVFEHEDTYDRLCIINKSTYVAHGVYGKHAGKWTSTGTQLIEPYVFKTLFSKEEVTFSDYCIAKSVSGGSTIFLDFNEGLPEGEHRYDFVGKVSAFTPVKPGVGGGELVRTMSDGRYASVTGAKGWRWMESSLLRERHKEDWVDKRYFNKLDIEAIEAINLYGSYDDFVDLSHPYLSPSTDSDEWYRAHATV